jgi:hypothetical protein
MTHSFSCDVKYESYYLEREGGHGVGQLVEALHYKQEGRGFDFHFLLT